MFRFNTPDRGISRRGVLYLNEITFAYLNLYSYYELSLLWASLEVCALFPANEEQALVYRLCSRVRGGNHRTQLHSFGGGRRLLSWKFCGHSIGRLAQHLLLTVSSMPQKFYANCCETSHLNAVAFERESKPQKISFFIPKN